MALFHLRMPISSFLCRHITSGTTRVSVMRCIAHMKSFQATQSFANTILCGETLTYIGRLSYSGRIARHDSFSDYRRIIQS
jgi:hypothetical protein